MCEKKSAHKKIFRHFTGFINKNYMAAAKVALILGAGPGLGSALIRKLRQAQFIVAGASRSAASKASKTPGGGEFGSDPGVKLFDVDAGDEAKVSDLVHTVESTLGPISFCCFNVGGSGSFADRKPVIETDLAALEENWRTIAVGGFVCLKHVGAVMAARGSGSIIITGATASMRGGALFARLAGPKAALRAISQSASRELAPRGVHIVHVVVDGVINVPGLFDSWPAARELAATPGSLLEPDAMAQTYLWLHEQPPSAWTFELELRPMREKY